MADKSLYITFADDSNESSVFLAKLLSERWNQKKNGMPYIPSQDGRKK